MKRHAFALTILALLGITLFAPALVKQEVFTTRDHFDYFQPLRWFTAEELKAGRLPFWNPYNASGEEWLANPQTGVFYPPAWLFLVLPFATAYMLFLLLHLVLLGWGAYLLFARNASHGAALIGAVALMFSGPVLSLLDINAILTTFAWVPFVLWCAMERAPIRGGLALALAFLGGEPFFAAIAALLFVITMWGRASARPDSRAEARATFPPLRDIAIAAIVAIGVPAVQLFPFLELIAGSDRAAGMDASIVFRDSMPLRDWLRVVVPPRLDASGFDPNLGQHFIPIVYLGVVAVVLALIGVARVREAWPWLLLLLATIAIAAGPSVLALLPLTLFRYPARVLPFASLAIAALVVLGWDRLHRGRRWVDLIIVLLLVADLLPRMQPLLRTAPFRTDVIPYDAEVGARAKILRTAEIDPAHRAAWISGYLNLYERRFLADTAAPISNERYLRLLQRIRQRPNRDLLAALPGRYILTRSALPPPFVAVTRAANARLYRYPHAFPMAMVLSRAEAITPAAFEIATSHVRVMVDAPSGGVLLLTQQDARGWRVTVDGKTAEKRLVFGIFRGVALPKGRHEIVWTYRSHIFFAGAATTIVTLFTLQLFLFVKRSRREKFFFRSIEF